MSFPIEIACPACKRNFTRVHPKHTRIPGECKFPDDLPMNMTCPMCLAGKSRDQPGHTFTDGCRVPGMRDITRIGEEPAREVDRVPRVAESRDQVGKIPPRAPEPDSADAEPAPAAEPAAVGPAAAADQGSLLPVLHKVSPVFGPVRTYMHTDKKAYIQYKDPTTGRWNSVVNLTSSRCAGLHCNHCRIIWNRLSEPGFNQKAVDDLKSNLLDGLDVD